MNKKGNAAIFTALFLPALLGCLVLSIDLAIAYSNRSKMEHIAYSAAMLARDSEGDDSIKLSNLEAFIIGKAANLHLKEGSLQWSADELEDRKSVV